MIHVADPKMVRLIALGKKVTHRFPANYRKDSPDVTHPKIVEGSIHKVYTEAPFGKDGNPKAQPMLSVYIEDIELMPLGDMIEEDARNEGFATLNAFVSYWDKVWFTKGLKFDNHLHHPVWVVYLDLEEIFPAGKKLIAQIEKRLNIRRG